MASTYTITEAAKEVGIRRERVYGLAKQHPELKRRIKRRGGRTAITPATVDLMRKLAGKSPEKARPKKRPVRRKTAPSAPPIPAGFSGLGFEAAMGDLGTLLSGASAGLEQAAEQRKALRELLIKQRELLDEALALLD